MSLERQVVLLASSCTMAMRQVRQRLGHAGAHSWLRLATG